MNTDSDVCQLCCEESTEIIKCSDENTEFMELFCQFVFNDTTHQLGDICSTCFRKLDDFGQFCESIRSVHRNLIEYSFAAAQSTTDVLQEDELEEHLITEEVTIDDKNDVFSTEADLVGDEDGDADAMRRRSGMTPEITRKLQQQLQFKAKAISHSDMIFDRIARFVPMSCTICKNGLKFHSIEEYNEHYLSIHGRSALYQCCNLQLETPYDLLDHIRYHESIDVFKCAACFKCFLSSNKLKYHIHRSHLPMEDLSDGLNCSICDKGFRNLRLLFNHQKSHILIACPHNCDKQVSASNYDHHIRTVHASQLQNKKRKIKPENEIFNRKQRNAEKGESSGSNKRATSQMNQSQARSFTMNIEPNDEGRYECDLCKMEFKQISLLFSHRNKVHV